MMKSFLCLCLIAIVTAHHETPRAKRQFLGGLGGLVGGGSSSVAGSVAKSGGAGLTVLGIPLIGAHGGYSEAVAASQSHTGGIHRVKRQFLGGLGGLVGGGSSSVAGSVAKNGGAGLTVLGIPLIGAHGGYSEAVAASQSHTGGIHRVKRQFLGGLGSLVGGASSAAGSVAKSGGAGLTVLGVPLVGVGANYNEAAAVSQSHTAGIHRV